jgi:hypothetical protein
MRPIQFDGQNVTFAEDQPEYLPLPALRMDDAEGTVISCWRLSFWERVRVLFLGCVWLSLWTFRRPLLPTKMSTERPFITDVFGASR